MIVGGLVSGFTSYYKAKQAQFQGHLLTLWNIATGGEWFQGNVWLYLYPYP